MCTRTACEEPMSDIQGTYRDGHVELSTPVNWPDGTPVSVQPKAEAPDDAWGIAEADYQDTPEFRARLIAQIDAFEPLELTAEEEAEWQAARKWIKDYTIAAVTKSMGL
jgi:hypothetical protein